MGPARRPRGAACWPPRQELAGTRRLAGPRGTPFLKQQNPPGKFEQYRGQCPPVHTGVAPLGGRCFLDPCRQDCLCPSATAVHPHACGWCRAGQSCAARPAPLSCPLNVSCDLHQNCPPIFKTPPGVTPLPRLLRGASGSTQAVWPLQGPGRSISLKKQDFRRGDTQLLLGAKHNPRRHTLLNKLSVFLEATPTRAGGAKVGWAGQPWLHCSWNAIPLSSRTSCLL